MENITIETISYAANIVFITWGFASLWKDSRKRKDDANFFNAAYEMAKRLADSLESHARHQAQDLTSFLLSATMNFMGKKRNEIVGMEEDEKRFSWLKKIFKTENK